MLVRKDLPLLFYVLKNHEVCKYFLFPHKIEQVRSINLSFFSNRRVEITLACEKYRLAHRSSSCFDEGGSQAIGTLSLLEQTGR